MEGSEKAGWRGKTAMDPLRFSWYCCDVMLLLLWLCWLLLMLPCVLLGRAGGGLAGSGGEPLGLPEERAEAAVVAGLACEEECDDVAEEEEEEEEEEEAANGDG